MMTGQISLDAFSRQIYTQDDAVQALYVNPSIDLSTLDLQEVEQFNRANELLYTGYAELKLAGTLDCTPEEYHRRNQKTWHMPAEYAEFDIAKWLLDQCETDEQRQRVGQELMMYLERGLFDLLNFLRYMVQVMRDNKIVWGVGRGSSVASYVLYLIGVHKIDSLYYDLDVTDFLR
jgi:DNA polymerase III alpha subunit